MKAAQRIAALGVLAWTMSAANCLADETTNPPVNVPAYELTNEPAGNPWQFGVTLPLWAPSIDGNVTVKGNQQNVDVNFDKLVNHLDAAFGLRVEAHKGRLGFYGEPNYLKFSGAGGGGLNGGASDDMQMAVVDGGVSYELLHTDGETPLLLEATAGIRYWWIKNDLSVTGPGGFVTFSSSAQKDLVDPMIGLRGSKYFTGKFHLDLVGDIGGFGITDNQATLDWDAMGLLSYDFTKWFTLSAGYKALALDYTSGGPADRSGANLIVNGAVINAVFKF